MKRRIVPALLMVVMLVVSCAKQGEQKSAHIAKVGKAGITQEDVTKEIKALPEQIQRMFDGAEGMERFIDELVKREMLYQEAQKKGLDKDADYQRKVEDFRRLSLISLLLNKEVEEKAKVSDKDVKDYYEAHKNELTANSQVRASHILVKTEDEAKKILEQIRKGEDFGKLAKSKSIDTGSAKNGGDLGFFSRGQMVPEFEKVAFGLKEGQVSEPVKTQFGYHLIKVTGKKEGTVVEFERMKDLLRQKVVAEKQKQVFDSYISDLKKSYTIEINKEAISKMVNEGKSKTETPAPPVSPEGKK